MKIIIGFRILPHFLNVINVVFFTILFSDSKSLTGLTPLQIGPHNYYVDYYGNKGTIEIIPIRTTQGLCYKLTPKDSEPGYMNIFIGSSIQSIDKLENINLMIATSNTWQGIVGFKWPYTKGLKISKRLPMYMYVHNIPTSKIIKIKVGIID